MSVESLIQDLISSQKSSTKERNDTDLFVCVDSNKISKFNAFVLKHNIDIIYEGHVYHNSTTKCYRISCPSFYINIFTSPKEFWYGHIDYETETFDFCQGIAENLFPEIK